MNPTARFDFSRHRFPIKITITSKTGVVLWTKIVEMPKDGTLAEVEIPGYAGTEHYPVSARIDYADGTFDTGAMQ